MNTITNERGEVSPGPPADWIGAGVAPPPKREREPKRGTVALDMLEEIRELLSTLPHDDAYLVVSWLAGEYRNG